MGALIDPREVSATFKDSLFHDEEFVDGKPTSEPVVAEGIRSRVGFQRERLESHRTQVYDWLAALPPAFRPVASGGGGGWSFLNACTDRNGDQWTGLHVVMDELFMLGIALGLAKWLLPRDMWHALPGGMPYVEVDIVVVEHRSAS